MGCMHTWMYQYSLKTSSHTGAVGTRKVWSPAVRELADCGGGPQHGGHHSFEWEIRAAGCDWLYERGTTHKIRPPRDGQVWFPAPDQCFLVSSFDEL